MKRTRAHLAPAFAAVLVLAACAGSDDDAEPVDSSAEQSVDRSSDETTDTGDSVTDTELRAPTPVEVVSGGANGVPSAASAESDVATSEMRIAPWVVEYVVGDGLPALPTNDLGYVYDATAPVTEEQVVSIATAFDVDGEPFRVDEGYGVSWRVGPDDGTAATMWVYADGLQSWNYNAPWDQGGTDALCAVSVDAEGNETDDCPEPEPPAGVPTADEAEQRVRELLESIDVDPAIVTFETYADEWSASVNAADGGDERGAVRSWYFGFAGGGVLQYAGGSLAAPQPVGPYPLVDLDTAVGRLTDGFGGGFGGGLAIGAQPAIESAVAPDGEPAGEPTSEPIDDAGTSTEVVEPLPVDPPVPADGEAVVATLVDVQPDLWWAWDPDGTVWLLPAYRFIDTEGGVHVVPAVTDDYLIQVDPATIDGAIPVETDSGSGAAPPESVPIDPTDGGTDAPDTVDIEPAPDPEVAISVLGEFVGLTIDEFTAEAEALGYSTRVAIQDGEPLAVTMDYIATRANVAVDGVLVVSIESMG